MTCATHLLVILGFLAVLAGAWVLFGVWFDLSKGSTWGFVAWLSTTALWAAAIIALLIATHAMVIRPA